MNTNEWKQATIGSVLLLLIMVSLSFYFSQWNHHQLHSFIVVQASKEEIVKAVDSTPEVEVAEMTTEEKAITESNAYIRISKGVIRAGKVDLMNQYISHSLVLHFYQTEYSQLTDDVIWRYVDKVAYHGEAKKLGKDDIIEKIQIKQKDGRKDVTLQITLNRLYEPRLYETETDYVITLASPRDLYDYVVVVDAGHGGNDEGTISGKGAYLEKNYNLKIVQLLKEKFDKQDRIRVYYTRLQDKVITKKQRTELANSLQADLFLSIHCNASEEGDTTAYGLEALYSKRSTISALSNKKLAKTMLSNLVSATKRRDRGVIRREQLYLLHHSKVPTTIIEIGYMSNKSDMKYLNSSKGRKKIVDGLYDGIMESLQQTY